MVSRELLLMKMAGYDITDRELQWFANYLSGRCLLHSRPMRANFFFLISIIVLFASIKHADDAVMFYTSTEIKSVLNHDLENLQAWIQ